MRESLKEYNRRMMREWRARKRQDPEWLAAHRKKECARVCAYYAAHPDKRREHWAKFVAQVRRQIGNKTPHHGKGALCCQGRASGLVL